MQKSGIIIPVGIVGGIVALAIIGGTTIYGYGKLNGNFENIGNYVLENKKGIAINRTCISENKDEVQKLASTVHEYIAVQTVKEEADDKREKLLIKIITDMNEPK